MTITFGEETLGDYSKARDKEWLITNNLGGYASSTITGLNTRGYHGLLIASTGPSLQRTLLLSKLEETVVINGKNYHLSTNRYPGVVHPDGYKHLKEFHLEPTPAFLYEFEGVTIHKTVAMIPKINCTVITYVTEAPESIEILVRPLTSNRDFHSRLRENATAFTQNPSWRGVTIESNTSPIKLSLESNLGAYKRAECWYRNVVYDEESNRGLADREDLYSPGVFQAWLNNHEMFRVTAFADSRPHDIGQIQSMSSKYKDFSLHGWLIRASEQFITHLPDEDCTIIAGYHWFGEWGRDAAISIPGLLLATRRYDVAKKLITRLLTLTHNGLTPNLTGEDGRAAYTSTDASLWLIYAAHKYYQYTGDTKFIDEIYPRLEDIVKCYNRGNSCIESAEDGLLESTVDDSSFTWMDARVNGYPVTPRVGKCVEVNALYYNALRSLEDLAKVLSKDSDFGEEAKRVKRAFNEAFWCSDGGYLYDYIGEDRSDASIRPNQILAVSLPFPVLDNKNWGRVYKVVEWNLLTPYGLRTLAPSDPKYRGRCVGSPSERDLSYHNGTVWPWLIGPFLTAHSKLGFGSDTLMVRHILNHFKHHLCEAGLGSISETFDGDPPHKPRGCIAQAWSVGELLRVIHEELNDTKLIDI